MCVCVCVERILEDHENLVENLLNWTRDGQNRLMFTERMEKYAVFKNPQVHGEAHLISNICNETKKCNVTERVRRIRTLER